MPLLSGRRTRAAVRAGVVAVLLLAVRPGTPGTGEPTPPEPPSLAARVSAGELLPLARRLP